MEPNALKAVKPFRGRGRAVPYGDVEVVGLLAGASVQRSAKRRLATPAMVCLGVGAGVVGDAALSLRGDDVIALEPSFGGPAVRLGSRLVPLHGAFAEPVLKAARQAGPGWLLGGGASRKNRGSDLIAGLANTDPRLVRLNTSRLSATWLAMQATAGVPLGDLLWAGGWSSTAPLEAVLPYLPRDTTFGAARLAGTTGPIDEGTAGAPDQEVAS